MNPPFLDIFKKSGWEKWVVFFVVLLNFIYHLLFAQLVILNNDEAISAVAGVEIAHDGIAYKDAVDHRGPVTYYLYALAFVIGGDYNMVSVRVLFAFLISLTGWVIYKTIEFVHPVLGILTSVVFCMLTVYGSPGDFLACHTEWPMCFFVVMAAYFLIKRMISSHSSRASLILSGMMMALAIFSKQVAVFDVLALGFMYLIFAVFSKRLNQIFLDACWISVGGLAVTSVVLFYFFLNGALQDFIFYTFTYNSEFYMRGREYTHFVQELFDQITWFFQARKYLIVVGLPSFLITLFFLWKIKNDRFFYYFPVGLAMLSIAVIGTCLSGRPFGHYQIQLLPYVSFIMGLCLYNSTYLIKLSQLIVGACVAVLVIFYWHMFAIQSKDVEVFFDTKKIPLLSYIERNKATEDKLFVWGFNAEPYVYLKIRPASRYSFCNFQTGLLPFTNKNPWINTESTIVPGSRNQLISDLRKTMPRFIIDSSPANYYFYGKYPLSSFSELDAFVKKNYFKVELQPYKAYSAHLYQRNP